MKKTTNFGKLQQDIYALYHLKINQLSAHGFINHCTIQLKDSTIYQIVEFDGKGAYLYKGKGKKQYLVENTWDMLEVLEKWDEIFNLFEVEGNCVKDRFDNILNKKEQSSE